MNLVPQSNDMTMLQLIAKTAAASGLYGGVGGEAKILMVLLAAHDLGIKPTIAINGGIWNIQGKIEISARLMTSMIRRAGHSIKIKECNDKICVLVGKRCDNQDELEASFSIEDAAKAGLANRDVWKKYAEDMLYSRAMSRLARRLFADVIGTAYVEGEIRDAETITINPEEIKEEQPIPEAIEVKEPELLTQVQIDELKWILSACTDDYIKKFWKNLEKVDMHDFSQIKQQDFETWKKKLIKQRETNKREEV
jgi:hypothetical protein